MDRGFKGNGCFSVEKGAGSANRRARPLSFSDTNHTNQNKNPTQEKNMIDLRTCEV